MSKVFNMCGGGQEAPQITVSNSGLITATSSGLSTTKQLLTSGSRTVTPITETMGILTPGYFTTGYINVEGDPDLIPANIKEGVTIFDVEGTYSPFTVVSGSTNSIISSFAINGNSIDIEFNTLEVSVPDDQSLTAACIQVDLSVDGEELRRVPIIIYPEAFRITGERVAIPVGDRGIFSAHITQEISGSRIRITASGVEFTGTSGVDNLPSFLIFS